MSYQTSDSRRAAVAELLRALMKAHRVLLTTHVNADGDGVGSEVALASWLRGQGKESWIVNPTPLPESLSFLLPDRGWSVDAGSPRARELAETADLMVVVDTGEVSRIGRVAELIRTVPTAVIDHHPAGSDPIPGLSFRDPEAAATGELVFDLLKKAGGLWPQETVVGLYVAILSDTGCFRFSNSSPAAHRITAELLEMGADPEETYRKVYGSVPLRKYRLLHAALGELEVDEEGRVAWMTVPTQAFSDLGATPDDIEGLVDYPRGIHGVEVGILFRETVRGATKVSFRSNGGVDVNALARAFGGGGHVKASGALVERPMDQVRADVIRETRKAIIAQGDKAIMAQGDPGEREI
jgi:bifunctional oligoribonuclease and PAP phosphatase NrnA